MLGTPITAGLFCPWCHATKDSTVIWHPYLDFCRQATRSTLTAQGNLHTRTHCISFLLFHIQELDFFHTFQTLSLLFLCDNTGWSVPLFVWLCWSRLPPKWVCVCVCVCFVHMCERHQYSWLWCLCDVLLKRKWCRAASARNHDFCSSEPRTHTYTLFSLWDKSLLLLCLFVESWFMLICRIYWNISMEKIQKKPPHTLVPQPSA